MGGGLLPVTSVAEIVLIDRQEFYVWRELLGISGRVTRLSLSDALRLAVLMSLRRELGGAKAALAFQLITPQLRDLETRDNLEVAWVQADRSAAVVSRPEDLLDIARRGAPVTLFSLSAELDRVRSAFERELHAPRRRRGKAS